MKKYLCEFIGTAVLVLFGCGSAAIAGGALGTLGIALAFGLSIVAMAYVIGNVSGCHINPAVSLAMLINKKMSVKDFICYVVAQVVGAIAGIGILYAIMVNSGLDVSVQGLGANGFNAASSVNLNMMGANTGIVNGELIIKGPTDLIGRDVIATDLRAGACLLIAGLIAEGTTTIDNAEHILRGYDNIVEKLSNVGAKIELK